MSPTAQTKTAVLTVLALIMSMSTIFAARGNEPKKEDKPVPPVLNFTMKSLAGDDVNLAKYQGKVILMVNTASKCGYTPQYKDLEALYKKYSDKGFIILGFPSNNFGGQEPGTDKEIAEFCEKNFGVTFDMFSKVDVKGGNQTALYKYLTGEQTDPKFPGEIKWNFEKFLIGKDGKIVARYRSAVKPSSDEVMKAIESELSK